MTANPIEPTQPAAISRFAHLWPILVSRGLCIFAFLFCLMGYLYGNKSLYGILVIHYQVAMMAFKGFFPSLIVAFIVSLYLIAAARKNWIKVAVYLVFTWGFLIFGMIPPILSSSSPLDLKILDDSSFHLAYYEHSTHRDGLYILIECNFLGVDCESIYTSELIEEAKPAGLLSINDDKQEVSILIDGEVVYTHPIE